MIIFQIGIEHDRTTWSIYAGCSGCQSKQQSSKGPTKSRGWPLHFHSASCRSQLWEPGSRILSSNECHETLAPNHPQKHRRAMDPCKIYDFIWIHINNEINYMKSAARTSPHGVAVFQWLGNFDYTHWLLRSTWSIWWIRTLVEGLEEEPSPMPSSEVSGSLNVSQTHWKSLKHI